MKTIGTAINIGLEGVFDIIDTRDEEALSHIAARQIELGADVLAVNMGGRLEKESDDVAWVTQVLQRELTIPLCFDSPNLEIFKSGWKVYDTSCGVPILNSTTAEENKMENAFSLAAELGVEVVALLMDEGGCPESAAERVKIAENVLHTARKFRLPETALFLDPLVFPVSSGQQNGVVLLDTLGTIKKAFPGSQTICGIDNISHGLPQRELLNVIALAMAMRERPDALLVNLNPAASAIIQTAQTLLGRDEFCTDYIGAFRNGELDIMKL